MQRSMKKEKKKKKERKKIKKKKKSDYERTLREDDLTVVEVNSRGRGGEEKLGGG